MEFRDVIARRYSCRKFNNKGVETEKLNAVLEAGRLAPTARNLQEQRVYVLQSSAALTAFDSVVPCRYGAPAVLVVAYDKNNVFTYPGGKKQSGDEDAAIVATHMILAATDEGLDSLWINHFDPEQVAKALSLPENEEVLMAMDLGYAAEGVVPHKLHSTRKELTDTVCFL